MLTTDDWGLVLPEVFQTDQMVLLLSVSLMQKEEKKIVSAHT
jgi:hypothetical protein